MVVRLVLIASRGGNVLMERWAHRDSATALIPRDSPLHQHQRRGGGGNIDDDETVTLQRGEALSWLHGAAAELLTGTETKDEEQIVMRRNGVPIVFVPIGDVIFYYVGSDDVDEMQLSLVHKALSRALKALLKRPITEALLFDSYAKVAATFDEIVYAGIVENLQEETVRRGSKLKLSAADQ